MDTIWTLCRKYTDLSDEEIRIIENTSAILQPLANLEDADIFIDCPQRDGDAIVVAEAKPEDVPSSYKNSVVGLLAKAENEPAVARTFRLGVGTKQMKATTQENGSTIQSVEPIRHGSRIIGVLIREKRVDEQHLVSERIHFSQKSYENIANVLTRMVSENNWLTECIDEALVMAAVDISGRGELFWDVPISAQKVGTFDTELGHEFFAGLARDAGITLHLRLVCGENAHHILEATFKAAARALREAVEPDPRMAGSIPSTKGSL